MCMKKTRNPRAWGSGAVRTPQTNGFVGRSKKGGDEENKTLLDLGKNSTLKIDG